MLKTKQFWTAMYSNDHGMYFLAKYSVDLDQLVKCPMNDLCFVCQKCSFADYFFVYTIKK